MVAARSGIAETTPPPTPSSKEEGALSAKLVFLGKLADLAGIAELEVQSAPLQDILALLPAPLAMALLDERVRFALNGELIGERVLVLGQGDELAFLPPVSGG